MIHDSSASDAADPYPWSGHVRGRDAAGGIFTLDGSCGALGVLGKGVPHRVTRPIFPCQQFGCHSAFGGGRGRESSALVVILVLRRTWRAGRELS